MNIVDNDLILRGIEVEDSQLLKDMINDPTIEKMVVGYSFPVSTHAQIDWIRNISTDKNNIRFIIEIKDQGAIGLITLSSLDFKNSTCGINIKLSSDKFKKKNIGFRVVSLVVEYAFMSLNINCINARILSYNSGSKKLFEKCGFSYEGTLRHRVYKQGEYQDLFSYSLLKEDYYA